LAGSRLSPGTITGTACIRCDNIVDPTQLGFAGGSFIVVMLRVRGRTTGSVGCTSSCLSSDAFIEVLSAIRGIISVGVVGGFVTGGSCDGVVVDIMFNVKGIVGTCTCGIGTLGPTKLRTKGFILFNFITL